MPIEARIVIHKLNFRDVLNTAKLIYNLGIKRVVLFPIDLRGNARQNIEKVMISNNEILSYVYEAVDFILDKGMDVELYHFPLCILKEKYRNFAKGITCLEIRITFGKFCSECKLKNKCSGLWKTYAHQFGTSELNPITCN